MSITPHASRKSVAMTLLSFFGAETIKPMCYVNGFLNLRSANKISQIYSIVWGVPTPTTKFSLVPLVVIKVILGLDDFFPLRLKLEEREKLSLFHFRWSTRGYSLSMSTKHNLKVVACSKFACSQWLLTREVLPFKLKAGLSNSDRPIDILSRINKLGRFFAFSLTVFLIKVFIRNQLFNKSHFPWNFDCYRKLDLTAIFVACSRSLLGTVIEVRLKNLLTLTTKSETVYFVKWQVTSKLSTKSSGSTMINSCSIEISWTVNKLWCDECSNIYSHTPN